MDYTESMLRLSTDLTEAFCLALEIKKGALLPLFEPDPHWQLKLVAYHPQIVRNDSDDVVEDVSKKQTFGVGAHTDTGFLTLVLQDDVGGLQVFDDGAWEDVPPTGPNVFVCNIGEVAEIMTCGYFHATPHPVLSQFKNALLHFLLFQPNAISLGSAHGVV